MKLSILYTILLCSLTTFTKTQAQEKILVQFFMHTTCPISQKYTLTINEIAKKFQNQPVQFELIFLDIKSTNQLLPEHAGELEMLMLKLLPTNLKRVC